MYADTKCSLTPDSAIVHVAAEMFALLSDPTRLQIILALRDGELSVNHLADIVDKTPASVSQHLARLRLSRMVVARQDGTRVFYRLANDHARRLAADAIFQAEHAIELDPTHHRTAHTTTTEENAS
ncbi:metalloregulator ArsR/SmtB family transcription factor [Microbacterium maritypicum]|uniref:ArsR/SmtB family transcription factor n=1 Tax=Microbacterium maritypicum TaxID=33918 RepID=UPI002672B8D5|nr:metalloregulator ArsR/SmtB family transcription factor [Microbacterium liquefaciens]WKT89585.1 metalloregulator ArsR/SmtB family transcription factor [Microbacterium liquefaciens]